MHDDLLGSGTAFDRVKSEIAQWIRKELGGARALTRGDLEVYSGRRIVAGWGIEVEIAGERHVLHVLLDGDFPYSPIRIALTSQDAYLRWPHVEARGVLCLPAFRRPLADPVAVLRASLDAAVDLVKRCLTEPDFVRSELQREFISYWGYSCPARALEVRSLLDLTNRTAREITVWFGQYYTLVGETPEQVMSWLRHLGREDKPHLRRGVFGFASEPPVPPFPDDPSELLEFVQRTSPEAVGLLEAHALAGTDSVVVIAAESEAGPGAIACAIDQPKMKGFRPGVQLNQAARRLLLARSVLERRKVIRVDGAWVHGRAMNKSQEQLLKSTVAVLGCGSLGSQVAVRLAQAGVGSLLLVDPELLATANIGRHALGVRSLGSSKAEELARNLSVRFPHLNTIDGFHARWEVLNAEQLGRVQNADIIVSCMGEWSAEGPLNEWHIRSGARRPIVYGWLGERGATAHGLAVIQASPCLACLVDDDGDMRELETVWQQDGLQQTEPACGTSFHPFGPIEVARAEAMVADLCMDVLTAVRNESCVKGGDKMCQMAA
jgi:molybdopterin/thiamine biosynthesis adenylyltransferase